MSSGMDDERAFAWIAQHLAGDDPALARRIAVLNRQFLHLVGEDLLRDGNNEDRVVRRTEEDEVTDPAADGERSWTVKVAVVLAVVAAVGLLLTAILSAPGRG